MKTYSLLMVLFLCVCSCSAQQSAAKKQAAAAFDKAKYDKAEKDALAYVKAIDVKTLYPSLPSQGLEDWLQTGPPHIDFLKWWLDPTCDLHGDDTDSDYPRCVRIDFRRGGHSGYLLILIGTLHKGIIGPPQLYEPISVWEEGFANIGGAERLSGLPQLLDKPLISTPVTDFFQQVVARHPIGIPTGADKTALWPFLSRRLTRQLESAQACQDDYYRQHANAGAGPKQAWINSGIFVGDGKRAAPFFINTGSKEAQKDGSYRVSMSAVERNSSEKDGSYRVPMSSVERSSSETNDSIIVGGMRAYRVAPNGSWLIVASVVPENDRFAIDDVRIFDGDSTDGPSHLLSETFVGCDGAHWTGEHVEDKPPVVLSPPHYTDWDAVNVLRSAAYKEEEAFAKALDVHQLDPSLPSQRLEDWLKSASLHLNHIEWDGLKCNIKEGQYGKEGEYAVTREPAGRLCAIVRFQRGNARASVNVSTLVKGNAGLPKVVSIGVEDKDDGLLTPMPTDVNMEKAPDSIRLSELPRLLDEEAVIDVTRNLFEAVVARHPLGIPLGPDKVKLGPLLSKRLREQLANGQACQEDYLRQNPVPATVPQPAWFNAGLFSGDGVLALPGADFANHKERQEDGSFQVLVWLARKKSGLTDSAPSASLWRTWHVSTFVKSEDGRFVVDDVRLFGDDSIDGPSRLLSDSFTGCDGPRWVGVGGTIR
jgi:hypothetical protein